MNRFRPFRSQAWRAWHDTALESFAYCRAVPNGALVFGEAERYALSCGRARGRKNWVENELARLLKTDDRASLHCSAHAYLTEWLISLGQMLEALQFGRAEEADAGILRAQAALGRRWAKVDMEISLAAGVTVSR